MYVFIHERVCLVSATNNNSWHNKKHKWQLYSLVYSVFFGGGIAKGWWWYGKTLLVMQQFHRPLNVTGTHHQSHYALVCLTLSNS